MEAYEASAFDRLATLRKKWHGVSVLPRANGVLETQLRKLAPAVHNYGFQNWYGQPDSHRHHLIGIQESCC